jgi:hypothetical protein
VCSGEHRRRTLWRVQARSLIGDELALHLRSFLQLASAISACWILFDSVLLENVLSVAGIAIADLATVLDARRWLWLYRYVEW